MHGALLAAGHRADLPGRPRALAGTRPSTAIVESLLDLSRDEDIVYATAATRSSSKGCSPAFSRARRACGRLAVALAAPGDPHGVRHRPHRRSRHRRRGVPGSHTRPARGASDRDRACATRSSLARPPSGCCALSGRAQRRRRGLLGRGRVLPLARVDGTISGRASRARGGPLRAAVTHRAARRVRRVRAAHRGAARPRRLSVGPRAGPHVAAQAHDRRGLRGRRCDRERRRRELADELGDVLLQIALHAQIAAEAGEFTIDDVVARSRPRSAAATRTSSATSRPPRRCGRTPTGTQIKRDELGQDRRSPSDPRPARRRPQGAARSLARREDLEAGGRRRLRVGDPR